MIVAIAGTKIKVARDLRIFLMVRINKNRRHSSMVKIPLRLPEIIMLYKAATIPKLERNQECFSLEILQKNTPTLATA